MEELIKVSVIIPVYNSELYLKECIESIVTQSLSGIEIICIDDGSVDSSVNIINTYAEKDKRLIVKSTDHKGVSAARNEGIRLAGGKYLYFMDSDDMLEKHALEHLYEKAERDSLDITFFNGKAYTKDRSFSGTVSEQNTLMRRVHSYPGVRNGVKMMESFYSNGEYWMTVWLQLYKRDFITQNNISFFEGIIHEDNLFAFESILSADRCGYLDEYLYLKRIRPESITTVRTNFDHIYGYYKCFIQMKRFLAVNKDKRNGAAEEIMNKALSECRRVCSMVDNNEKFKYLELPYDEQVDFKGLVLDYMDASLENMGQGEASDTKTAADEKKKSGFIFSVRRFLHRIFPSTRYNVAWSYSNLTAQHQVQMQMMNHVISENMRLARSMDKLEQENKQIVQELNAITERIDNR